MLQLKYITKIKIKPYSQNYNLILMSLKGQFPFPIVTFFGCICVVCPISRPSYACPPHEPPSHDVPPPSCNMCLPHFSWLAQAYETQLLWTISFISLSCSAFASTASFYRCSSLHKISHTHTILIKILAQSNTKMAWFVKKLTKMKTCLVIVIAVKT